MGLDVQRIGQVTLPVTYLKRSVEFYRDVLGLRPVEQHEQASPKEAWFAVTDAQRVHLVYGVGWQGEGLSAHHQFTLHVTDLDAARAYLASTGWPAGNVEMLADGSRRMVVKDPDGHLVELCEARG